MVESPSDCNQHLTSEIKELRKACSDHSQGTIVLSTYDGLPDWQIKNGRLYHTKADYFSVGLYFEDERTPCLMMEQPEKALIMLLKSTLKGQSVVLLSLRTEPGLIGLTNLSTTIQSTPSNYLRKHGGKGTPFIEYASNPAAFGTIIYDGMHYDWGGYYMSKTKRFLILELESFVEAPSGFCWVAIETAYALLAEDHLITNDLRVCIPLLGAKAETIQPTSETVVSRMLPVLTSTLHTPTTTDHFGTSIAFFETRTETREVNSWVQPLLVPKGDMLIRLFFMSTNSGKRYAIEKRTQIGLLGSSIWFTAEMQGGAVIRSVKTSAEGGRFWRYPIHIEIVEVENSLKLEDHYEDNFHWVTFEDLCSLIQQPLQTSLELRMAWSLLCTQTTESI